MARIAGRSNWVAWPIGVICAGVVVTLAWLSAPMLPSAVEWAGDALRGPTSRPIAGPASPERNDRTGTAACRALYTRQLWSELTARQGGDPVQDASLPTISAVSVVAALAPTVRTTCAWTGASTGSIVTTFADVSLDAVAIAQAALSSQGFTCEPAGTGVTCRKRDGEVVEDITVRDGEWLSSRFEAWHPTRYTARVSSQLWPR